MREAGTILLVCSCQSCGQPFIALVYDGDRLPSLCNPCRRVARFRALIGIRRDPPNNHPTPDLERN